MMKKKRHFPGRYYHIHPDSTSDELRLYSAVFDSCASLPLAASPVEDLIRFSELPIPPTWTHDRLWKEHIWDFLEDHACSYTVPFLLPDTFEGQPIKFVTRTDMRWIEGDMKDLDVYLAVRDELHRLNWDAAHEWDNRWMDKVNGWSNEFDPFMFVTDAFEKADGGRRLVECLDVASFPDQIAELAGMQKVVVQEKQKKPLIRKPDSKTIFIYFIEGTSGHIKIGKSVNPTSRLESLQTASPVKLKILKTIPEKQGMTEKDLHRRFQHLRTSGEWFTPSDELHSFIEAL